MFKVHLGGQVFETKQVCGGGGGVRNGKKLNKVKRQVSCRGENICNIYSKKSIDSCKKSSNT